MSPSSSQDKSIWGFFSQTLFVDGLFFFATANVATTTTSVDFIQFCHIQMDCIVLLFLFFSTLHTSDDTFRIDFTREVSKKRSLHIIHIDLNRQFAVGVFIAWPHFQMWTNLYKRIWLHSKLVCSFLFLMQKFSDSVSYGKKWSHLFITIEFILKWLIGSDSLRLFLKTSIW